MTIKECPRASCALIRERRGSQRNDLGFGEDEDVSTAKPLRSPSFKKFGNQNPFLPWGLGVLARQDLYRFIGVEWARIVSFLARRCKVAEEESVMVF